MSLKSQYKAEDEAPASIPQTPPPPQNIGYGHPEYQFVSSIMEMQKSLGEINSSIKDLSVKIDSTAHKVDNLYKWKHMILGGAVVLGAIFGLGGWTVNYVTDHYSLTPKESQQVDRLSTPDIPVTRPSVNQTSNNSPQ